MAQTERHTPAEHTPVEVEVLLQKRPQAPQLDDDIVRSVSQPLEAAPSQSPHPASQVKPQRPKEHDAAVAWEGTVHAVVVYPSPSALHTRRSVDEAQLGSPGVHVHALQRPPEQLDPAGHADVDALNPSAAQTLTVVVERQVALLGVQVHARHTPPEQLCDAAQAVVDELRPSPLHTRREVTETQSTALGVHDHAMHAPSRQLCDEGHDELV